MVQLGGGYWVAASCSVLLAACSSSETIKGSGCESCHRPPDAPSGIEVPHPSFALNCGHCHGGDDTATTIAEAHVPNPGSVDVRTLAQAQLAELAPEYRRFINPSDVVAAAQTCGTSGSQGCHQAITAAVEVSVHSTLAGILNPERVNAGLTTDREPRYGPRSIGSLEPLPVPDVATASSSDIARFVDHALGKACSGCHLGNYGQRGAGRPQNVFSSGCAACHLLYAEDGLGQSGDPNISRTEIGHPIQHQIARTIPDRQCEYCHFGSNRIGTQFRGLRELTAADTNLENAERIEAEIHGKPGGFYVVDDDRRDPIDLTPPDVHQQRGMGCVDCHLGQDVHGDGQLHPAMGAETGVECEDCHGSFTERAGGSGTLATSGGALLTRMRVDGGRVILTGALDGRDRVVPQLLDLRQSLALDLAHSRGNHGELECYSCHTAWMQNFLLVERTIDLRDMSDNPLDGRVTAGSVRDTNLIVVLDALFLGRNADGKIGTFMAENALLSVVVACDPRTDPGCEPSPDRPGQFGRKLIDRSLREVGGDRVSLSFRPTFAHTVGNRATVRACETCHSRQYETNPTRPGVAYGRGSGRFFAPLSGAGTPVDLTRMTDTLGNAVVPLGHRDSAPVDLEKVRRALNYRVLPPLR
jgi:hypothetical protein